MRENSCSSLLSALSILFCSPNLLNSSFAIMVEFVGEKSIPFSLSISLSREGLADVEFSCGFFWLLPADFSGFPRALSLSLQHCSHQLFRVEEIDFIPDSAAGGPHQPVFCECVVFGEKSISLMVPWALENCLVPGIGVFSWRQWFSLCAVSWEVKFC